MRELTTHKVNGVNDGLTVKVMDEPGPGGANHLYYVEWPGSVIAFPFQNGTLKEAGVNGVTNETLLVIAIDRLEGFQRGPYACAENQTALDHLYAAKQSLLKRTGERLARGVEGTHQK